MIEGLENDGLIEAAVQLGVDAGQGYGIARPMPRADLVAWASGYHLELDPAAPRSPLGLLAAHVAWEHRVTALSDHPARPLAPEDCALTAHAARLGTEVDEAHERVHAAARAQRGSLEHRTAWGRLVVLVEGS